MFFFRKMVSLLPRILKFRSHSYKQNSVLNIAKPEVKSPLNYYCIINRSVPKGPSEFPGVQPAFTYICQKMGLQSLGNKKTPLGNLNEFLDFRYCDSTTNESSA